MIGTDLDWLNLHCKIPRFCCWMHQCVDYSSMPVLAVFYQQHAHEKLGHYLSNTKPNVVQWIHNLLITRRITKLYNYIHFDKNNLIRLYSIAVQLGVYNLNKNEHSWRHQFLKKRYTANDCRLVWTNRQINENNIKGMR